MPDAEAASISETETVSPEGLSDDKIGTAVFTQNQFNIAQAKQKLPKILDDPLFLYEGKKASSVQFVENYSDDYYLMIPVKCLPSELWIETMFIEDKKRFTKRWGKRKLLYERK